MLPARVVNMIDSFKWIKSFIYQILNSFWKRKPLLLAILIVAMFSLIALQYSTVGSKTTVLQHGRLSKSLSRADIFGLNPSFSASNLSQRAVLPRPFGGVAFKAPSDGGTSGEDWQPLKLPSGEPSDPDIRMKRETVKEMMKFAWDNYVKYAWGENELRPISRRGHSAGIFGRTKLGKYAVTISWLYWLMITFPSWRYF